MAADFKALSRNDQGALVAGALAILFSFFGAYVTVSVDGGEDLPGLDYSAGTNAWESFATLGMLLLVVAVVVVAVKAFAAQSLPDGVPWRLVALATAALGTLLVVVRAFTAGGDIPSGLGGVSVGPGWSGWLLFVAAIALTVFTALAFKDSGEKLPEANKKNDPPAA